MSLSTYSCGTSLVVSSVDLIGEWVETLSGDFVDSDEFLSSGQRSPVESIEILPNNGACIAWLDSLPEDGKPNDFDSGQLID